MQPTDLITLVSGGGAGVIVVLAYFLQLFVRHKLHADEELAALQRYYEARLTEMREDRDLWRTNFNRLIVTQEIIVPPLAGDAGRKPSL